MTLVFVLQRRPCFSDHAGKYGSQHTVLFISKILGSLGTVKTCHQIHTGSCILKDWRWSLVQESRDWNTSHHLFLGCLSYFLCLWSEKADGWDVQLLSELFVSPRAWRQGGVWYKATVHLSVFGHAEGVLRFSFTVYSGTFILLLDFEDCYTWQTAYEKARTN